MATGNNSTKAGRGKSDTYAKITDQIVQGIESASGKFEMPWHRGDHFDRPKNALTERPYSGVNVVALWAAAYEKRYGSNYWATFRQWGELGAHVRKHEKGTPAVFYKKLSRFVEDKSSGKQEERHLSFAKTSWLFNADQVSGYVPVAEPRMSLVEIVQSADEFVSATNARILHGGDRAYYDHSADRILMPNKDLFTGTTTSNATQSYYAVLFHELTHWTGHETRLDRRSKAPRDKQDYALEELVAELGGAFLCADHHVANEPRSDHASYVAGWLTVLKNDKRAVFKAARQASNAVEFLEGIVKTNRPPL